MAQRFRLAVVSANATDLQSGLEALADRPEVRRFGDLYGAAEALRRFGPAVIFLQQRDLTEMDAGAIRLLQHMLGEVTTVLVCPRDKEVALQPMAAQLGVELLIEPWSLAQLSNLIAHVVDRQNRNSVEALHDLTRGISDEINNPLMFVSGHLQLLRQRLDPAENAAEMSQLDSIHEGLRRIQGTMAKLQLVCEAAHGRRPTETVDLTRLIASIVPTLAGNVRIDPPTELIAVRGRTDQLRAAIELLCAVGVELVRAEGQANVEIRRIGQTACVCLSLRGDAIAAWRLPRSFEPYYLNSFLRGTTHGLNLFVVQTIVRGHGGKALARRAGDGGLLLELEFAHEPSRA